MTRVLARPSVAISEASVNGPYRPSGKALPSSINLRNSDYPLAPQQLKTSQVRTTPAPAVELKTVQRTAPPVQPTISEQPSVDEPKISLGKRILTLTGVFVGVIGVVGGFISIAGLGPFGLVVSAGSALLASALIKLGNKK